MIAKEFDRRELVLAVWAAEFARALGDTTRSELGKSPVIQRGLAELAARSADRAVEALRLLVDVQFRRASYDELDRCYMPWEQFVEDCRRTALTDYDGHELATADHVSDVRVQPSEALDPSYARPDWATHVVWYNR